MGALRSAGHNVHRVPLNDQMIAELELASPDFVVPCVLDERADAGVVQDTLEVLGLPYVGARGPAVRTCADKVITKHVLQLAKLPTLPHRVISARTVTQWGIGAALAKAASHFDNKIVIKPVHGNGAMGIKLCVDLESVSSRVTNALHYDTQIILEPYVTGRELSVIVVGPPDAPELLGVAEVVSPMTTNVRNPSLWHRTFAAARPISLRIEKLAIAAYAALGCRDYASIDILIDAQDDAWIIEVDTALDLAADGRFGCAAESTRRSLADAIGAICSRVEGAYV